MELHLNVFDLQVEDMVFCKSSCGVVVAVEGGTATARKSDVVKQLAEENGLM